MCKLQYPVESELTDGFLQWAGEGYLKILLIPPNREAKKKKEIFKIRHVHEQNKNTLERFRGTFMLSHAVILG